MDRDCINCIHNIGGGCKKWDCEMETLADHDKQIRADVIDECIQAIEDTKRLFDNSTKWIMGEKTRIQNRLKELKENKNDSK